VADRVSEVHVKITGNCHCRNIELALDWKGPEDIPARACGCSFCVKHGGVWTSHPTSSLEVVIRIPSLMSRYSFATGTADFHICARCGVVPLVTCDIAGRVLAVVNVNALEGIDRSRLHVSPAVFDGEDVDARLARRQRNWIGTVSMAERPS
jgi:hypothetical protein